MKSVITFALTCVSAVMLLSACGGGGGGGGSSVSPVSPLPPSVTGDNGVRHQTYTQSLVTQANGQQVFSVGIDPDALINYYSGRYGPDDKVTDANSEFLFFWNALPADQNSNLYQVIRNSASGKPVSYAYAVLAGNDVATLLTVSTPGAQMSNGQEFVLDMGNSALLTIEVIDRGLVLEGSTLSVSNDYGLNAYSPNSASQLPNYGLYLHAEYSALYAEILPSSSATNLTIFAEIDSGGALTDLGDIPTSGNLTYNIDHAIGAITDGRLNSGYSGGLSPTGHGVLIGTGSLVANFGSRNVRLMLDVDYHDNTDFTTVDLTMPINQNRNQFYCGEQGTACRLQPTSGLQVIGSFYGPNAEEVAGGIRGNLSNDRFWELGFIGKR